MKPSTAHLFVVWVLLAGACGPAEEEAPEADPLESFIESYRRADGGFGLRDQEGSDTRWTWRAIRCLEIAGLPVRSPDDIGAFLESVPAIDLVAEDRALAHLLCMRELGISGSLPQSSVPLAGRLASVLTTWLGSVPLRDMETAVHLRVLSGAAKEDAELVEQFLAVWRGADGGYRYPVALEQVFELVEKGKFLAGLPRPGGQPSSMEITAAAVAMLTHLQRPVPEPAVLVKFIESLEGESGGYRHRKAGAPGAGLWSTWHALRTLQSLNADPRDASSLVRWILAHQRNNGGFAPAIGESASLEATWLALECLHILDHRVVKVAETAPVDEEPPAVDARQLTLYQAVLEVGPDAGVTVMLARRIGADLVLMKGTSDAHAGPDVNETLLAQRVVRIARGQGMALEAACVREEHSVAWGAPGVGYATHCSDVIFAPGATLGARARHDSFDSLLEAWKSVRKGGGRVFSCSFLSRELLAPVYDRMSRREPGYDALMATWALAPEGDVVRERPWLARYTQRVPVVGNHDAHGDPFHWLCKGLLARTLFFAEKPDLAGFLDALLNRRTVAVAHRGQRLALHGHPIWVERARKGRILWDIGRRPDLTGFWVPDPVIVPIDDAAACELPHFRSGHALLVRAAARIGDDAFPFEVTCSVDGQAVPLELVPPMPGRRPALWAPLPDLEKGEHKVVVEAFGRRIAERLRFGDPVSSASERLPGDSSPVPVALSFAGISEIPFVQAAVALGDLSGSIALATGRADFLLRGVADSGDLVIEHSGGAAAGKIEVFVDGAKICALVATGMEPLLTRVPVPPVDRTRRITIRTELPGWMPSLPIPSSDLRLHRLALVPGEDK